VAPATTATTRSKPTTAGTQSQSSTLGSTTTPWVRKFLAGRPKGKQTHCECSWQAQT
jgi:hypothetical protein